MARAGETPGGNVGQENALRSVHTSNLPELFRRLGISLVVSTYQAGKVILVRADGEALNTHFRTFNKPMGVSADGNRITIGGSNTVWYYRNMPAVAKELEPAGRDALHAQAGVAKVLSGQHVDFRERFVVRHERQSFFGWKYEVQALCEAGNRQ